MENAIKSGDRVRHASHQINNGLGMEVIDVEGDRALCGHFVGSQSIHKEDWFSLKDLELISKSDGSFFDM